MSAEGILKMARDDAWAARKSKTGACPPKRYELGDVAFEAYISEFEAKLDDYAIQGK